jgi:hypothetical protein
MVLLHHAAHILTESALVEVVKTGSAFAAGQSSCRSSRIRVTYGEHSGVNSAEAHERISSTNAAALVVTSAVLSESKCDITRSTLLSAEVSIYRAVLQTLKAYSLSAQAASSITANQAA